MRALRSSISKPATRLQGRVREPRRVVACSSVDPSLLGPRLLTCISIFHPCAFLKLVTSGVSISISRFNGRICAVVLAPCCDEL